MDQRLLYTRYIISIAVCIILCNQLIHLYRIYKQEKHQYIHQQNDLLKGSVCEFNLKSTNYPVTGNRLNYNATNNQITYVIQGKIITKQFDSKNDIRKITERSYYDIRDPKLWTLKKFYSFLGTKHDGIKSEDLSLQLVIQDSTGIIKDSYPKTVTVLPASPTYRDTLGYISGEE